MGHWTQQIKLLNEPWLGSCGNMAKALSPHPFPHHSKMLPIWLWITVQFLKSAHFSSDVIFSIFADKDWRWKGMTSTNWEIFVNAKVTELLSWKRTTTKKHRALTAACSSQYNRCSYYFMLQKSVPKFRQHYLCFYIFLSLFRGKKTTHTTTWTGWDGKSDCFD